MSEKQNFLIPTDIDKPGTANYWKGLKENKFLTTKCKDCGELFFPPRIICPKCLSKNLEWVELSGRGKLYSWTEAFEERMSLFFDIPYIIGLIDLEEGIGRLITKVDAKPEQLKIDMPMRLIFVKHRAGGDEYTLPHAVPV